MPGHMMRNLMLQIADFNPPTDYMKVAGNSFSPEGQQLGEELRRMLPVVLDLANMMAAMLRDLEGPETGAPRVCLSEANTIVHEQGYVADLMTEVLIYREGGTRN